MDPGNVHAGTRNYCAEPREKKRTGKKRREREERETERDRERETER